MYILEFTAHDGSDILYRIPFHSKEWATKYLNQYIQCTNDTQHTGNQVMRIETDDPYDFIYAVPLVPMFACIHKK